MENVSIRSMGLLAKDSKGSAGIRINELDRQIWDKIFASLPKQLINEEENEEHYPEGCILQQDFVDVFANQVVRKLSYNKETSCFEGKTEYGNVSLGTDQVLKLV